MDDQGKTVMLSQEDLEAMRVTNRIRPVRPDPMLIEGPLRCWVGFSIAMLWALFFWPINPLTEAGGKVMLAFAAGGACLIYWIAVRREDERGRLWIWMLCAALAGVAFLGVTPDGLMKSEVAAVQLGSFKKSRAYKIGSLGEIRNVREERGNDGFRLVRYFHYWETASAAGFEASEDFPEAKDASRWSDIGPASVEKIVHIGIPWLVFAGGFGIWLVRETRRGRCWHGCVKRISDRQARLFIGHIAIVTGKVSETRRLRGYTYVNFGRPFPNHTFSLVFPRAVAHLVPCLDQQAQWLRNARQSSGTIEEFRGRPQIIVTRAEQIDFESICNFRHPDVRGKGMT